MMPSPAPWRLAGLLTAAWAMASTPHSALANASVYVGASYGCFDTCAGAASDTQTGPFQASNSLDVAGASLSGYADLSLGILRARAVADPTPSSGASTISAFSDSLVFAPGTAGTAYLKWHWDGVISRAAELPANYAAGILHVQMSVTGSAVFPDWSFEQAYVLRPKECYDWVQDVCQVGKSIDQFNQLAVPIYGGEAYHIYVDLIADANFGATSNFSSTGRFYLEAPAGVTYTSTSGKLFAEATPVPEPATRWLLASGGLLVCVVSRRRSRSGAAGI